MVGLLLVAPLEALELNYENEKKEKKQENALPLLNFLAVIFKSQKS